MREEDNKCPQSFPIVGECLATCSCRHTLRHAVAGPEKNIFDHAQKRGWRGADVWQSPEHTFQGKLQHISRRPRRPRAGSSMFIKSYL